jgi:hypothetical protein
MSNILNPLFDHTVSFRPWASYLHSIIMKNKNPKIDVVLSGYKKDIIDDERIMRNNIIAARNLDPKTMDSKFSSMLIDIQDIFTWIESYNSDFRIERVESSFEYLNIKWNDSQFELIKELSVAVVPIMEETFKRLIKYSINHSVFNSDPKFRHDLFKKITSPFILYILKTSSGETIFEEKASDSITPKITTRPNHSFVIDYGITIDMDKESAKSRKQKLNDEFLNMLGQLKGKGFISEDATPAKLKGLIGNDNVKSKVKWLRSIGSLHYFVTQIAGNLNTQHSIWQSAINCFTDKNDVLYTIEQLRDNPSEKDYAKYQSSIESITSIFIKSCNSSRKNKT